MTYKNMTAIALAAGLLAAACSPSPEAPSSELAPTPPVETGNLDPAPATASEPTVEDTIGGDGSEITLMPVQPDDVAGLQGELGCSFSDEYGDLLLVAMADVSDSSRAQAAVNNNGYGERLMAQSTGGFSALEPGGAAFSGRGLTVTVTPGERASENGTESVTSDALLLVQRGDGAERRFDGEWTCGP